MAGSGVYRLRNSKKAPKKMPREFHSIVDNSGLRGTGTRNVNVDVNVGSDLAPSNQYRAFETTKNKYPMTPQPKSAEHGLDGEGKIRGRQADKSSRSK